MSGRALAPVALALLAGLWVCYLTTGSAAEANVPQGFGDETVIDDVPAPTALAFIPDDHLLVASKPGQLHVFSQNGTVVSSPALNIGPKVCSGNTERGLLGVAVDPNFETQGNNFVYHFYTFTGGGQVPRVVPTGS